MTLTDEERLERDPRAIQQTLLEIEKAMDEMALEYREKVRTYADARADYEELKGVLDMLKARRSTLQSVLRTLDSWG